MSEIPTSESVVVNPWNTAVNPRFTYGGICVSDRDEPPAGSWPQNNHHHAEASAVGMVAIAAAFQRRRKTVNSKVADDEERPETRRGHGDETGNDDRTHRDDLVDRRDRSG